MNLLTTFAHLFLREAIECALRKAKAEFAQALCAQTLFQRHLLVLLFARYSLNLSVTHKPDRR